MHNDDTAFALMFNSASNGVEFTLPKAPHKVWKLALSSDSDQVVGESPKTVIVADHSFTLLESKK